MVKNTAMNVTANATGAVVNESAVVIKVNLTSNTTVNRGLEDQHVWK